MTAPSITVAQMRPKLLTLDYVRQALAMTEPLSTRYFTVGDQVRFTLDQGWQHGLDARPGTDRIGAYPSESPVTPGDFMATICHCLGVDPHSEIHDQFEPGMNKGQQTPRIVSPGSITRSRVPTPARVNWRACDEGLHNGSGRKDL